MITKALKEKRGAPPSEQLSYASEVGNALLRVQPNYMPVALTGLANQLEGQPAVTAENAISLVQALMGGQQIAQSALAVPDDMMSQMVGALLGGGSACPTTFQPAQARVRRRDGPDDRCVAGRRCIFPYNFPTGRNATTRYAERN